jgi:hypothetical protein
MRIRILLLIKVTNRLQTPPGLHYSIMSVHCPPRLHFEPLKLRNFDLNVDPDPAFRSNTDQGPAIQNNTNPSAANTVRYRTTVVPNARFPFSFAIKTQNTSRRTTVRSSRVVDEI